MTYVTHLTLCRRAWGVLDDFLSEALEEESPTAGRAAFVRKVSDAVRLAEKAWIGFEMESRAAGFKVNVTDGAELLIGALFGALLDANPELAETFAQVPGFYDALRGQ